MNRLKNLLCELKTFVDVWSSYLLWFQKEAITSILYNRDNNSITISRWGLRGNIFKCIKKSYYIHDEVFLHHRKQKRYENLWIHRFSNYHDLWALFFLISQGKHSHPWWFDVSMTKKLWGKLSKFKYFQRSVKINYRYL